MKDSIVIDMKYADYDMIDGSYGVERHHLMGGADRSHADEDGLWVPLSPDHHNSSRMSVHHNKEMKVMSHMSNMDDELLKSFHVELQEVWE